MSKRFTDTDKWKREWFCSLSPIAKLVWMYMLDECDHCGVYHVNLRRLAFDIGEQISREQIDSWFGTKMIKIEEDKYFIPSFIIFQQGMTLNPENNSHKPIISFLRGQKLLLNKINILPSPLLGADKGLARGPGKGKGKSNGKSNSNNSLFLDLNKKEKKESAERSDDLFTAVGCYLNLQEVFRDRKVTTAVQQAWVEAYPDSEWVVEKIKQLLAWEAANPAKRKKNFARFVGNCLARDWDSRRVLSHNQGNQQIKTDIEAIRRLKNGE